MSEKTLNRNSKPQLSILQASADANANACANGAVRAEIAECLGGVLILSALIFFLKVENFSQTN